MDEKVEILLIEDNPDDAELTMMTIDENNISNEVVWLRDGAEAIEYLFAQGQYADRNTQQRPRIILLDLKLPKLSGIEVLHRIKGDHSLRTIPVVVMTSSKEELDLRNCYELGVNSYIVKPVNFSQFKNSVKQLGVYWLSLNEAPPQ